MGTPDFVILFSARKTQILLLFSHTKDVMNFLLISPLTCTIKYVIIIIYGIKSYRKLMAAIEKSVTQVQGFHP